MRKRSWIVAAAGVEQQWPDALSRPVGLAMPAEPVVVVVESAAARGGMPLHYRPSVAPIGLYLPMSCRARRLRELHSSLPMWQPRYSCIGWLRRRGLESLAKVRH